MQPGDPDDAVLARFAAEAADDLTALGEALLRLETDPAPEVYSDAERRLHTLKGAASAAGLSAAAHLANLLEDVIAECQAGRLTHTPALNDVLLRALDTLAAIRLSIVEGGAGQVELSGSFSALESILAPALHTATSVPPGVASPSFGSLTTEEAAELQAEIRALRGEFLESSVEKVAQLAQGLVGLEGRPDDVDLVNALFRIAHSLKGGGATFGLPVLSTVAHALEDVLDEIRCGKRRPTSETVSILLTGADALQRVIRQPDAVTEQSPEIVTAIGSLKSVLMPH